MKIKILSTIVIVTLATAGTLTYAASTNAGSTNILQNVFSGMHRAGSGGLNKEFGGRGIGRFAIMGK